MSLLRALDRNEDLLLAQCVASADRAEAIVRAVWLELLAVIRAGGPWFLVYLRAHRLLQRLGPLLAAHFARDLSTIAVDAHDRTVATLDEHAPERKSHRAEALLALLLVPLAGPIVQRLVQGRGGAASIVGSVAAIAPAAVVAAQVANGVQAGQGEREVAELVLPAIQGVQTAARRKARTDGMAIGHDSQIEVYERLRGDGYQVLSMRDDRVRPKHRRRHGWKYYREPGPGQRGFDEMPRPPFESPRDGNVLAWNCRCYLRPIIQGLWAELG